MATLNLNTARRPTLDVTFEDELETTLHICFPTQEMVKALKQIDVSSIKEDDQSSLSQAYDIAAQFISRNRESVMVTAADLQTTYNMDLEALIIFFNAYADYVTEVVRANAKN